MHFDFMCDSMHSENDVIACTLFCEVASLGQSRGHLFQLHATQSLGQPGRLCSSSAPSVDSIILRCEVVSTTANCVGCNIEGRRQCVGTLERRLCNKLCLSIISDWQGFSALKCPQHFLVGVTVLHLIVCCQAVLLVQDSC